jgi:nitrate reductase cytochrome c-type subunit
MALLQKQKNLFTTKKELVYMSMYYCVNCSVTHDNDVKPCVENEIGLFCEEGEMENENE